MCLTMDKLCQGSWGPEPFHRVGPSGQPPSLGNLRHLPEILESPDHPGGRQYGGTPFRAENHGQKLLSRGAALHEEARDPLLWPDMSRHDALGPIGTVSLSILWNCGCSTKVGPLLDILPARTQWSPPHSPMPLWRIPSRSICHLAQE